MRKPKEILYYNDDNTAYIQAFGNHVCGIFKKDDCSELGYIKECCGDMSLWSCDDKHYFIRQFRKKGFCFVYEITSNIIDFKNPSIWCLPLINFFETEQWKAVIMMDESFKCFEEE